LAWDGVVMGSHLNVQTRSLSICGAQRKSGTGLEPFLIELNLFDRIRRALI
jgi:hypothetical protein